MLCSFPFQGYALFSIVFSTLFLLASYWFTWFFLKHTPVALKKTNSYKCMRISLWYLVISSLGPWALGAIMNTLGAQSIWYRLAIYFYLHFLYNGWMLLALVGIVFYIFEQHKIIVSKKAFRNFFWSLNLGVLLSFFLSHFVYKTNNSSEHFWRNWDLSSILVICIFGNNTTWSETKTRINFFAFSKGFSKNRNRFIGYQNAFAIVNSLSLFRKFSGNRT